MAPLHNSNSSEMQAENSTSENDVEGIVEVDRKWQSPPSSKTSATRSPTMPRRSDASLDFGDGIIEMSPTKNSSGVSPIQSPSTKSHSLSPRSMLHRQKSNNRLNNLALEMSVTSFTAFVDQGISPPPSMPHRRVSTHEDDHGGPPNNISDGELGGGGGGNNLTTWQSNHTVGGRQDDMFMTLNDANGPTDGKKRPRRIRRGVQRAFSDSELSEASTINSQKESKKERKQSILKRRKERLARTFLGRGKAAKVPNAAPDGIYDEEEEDVVDTDKDLEGFIGIAIKKQSGHSTTTDNESHPLSSGDDVGSVVTKKTQNEIDVETRSRVSKSPIRFPGRDRSRSRGRARSSSRRGRASGSSVAAETTEKAKKKKKKKKSSSLSRRGKKASDNDSTSSSDDDYEKPPRSGSKARAPKSPGRRKKSASARRAKKGGRKPIAAPLQVPLNDDWSHSQRTMTDLVVNVPPTQEFVSPCTIGSGRRSVMDTITPSNRSRNSKVSAITMSTGMFSPFTAVSSEGFCDDFSNHTENTNSSLRGPKHIPNLEASERQSNTMFTKGNLSAVFEDSSRADGMAFSPSVPTGGMVFSSARTDGLGRSGRNDGFGISGRSDGLGYSARTEGASPYPSGSSSEMGGTPRSTLRMPAVPRRRPSSSDHSLTSSDTKGPLFDNSSHAEEEHDEVPFDRFAPMVKVRSSSDLMIQAPVDERPTIMLKKSASERNVFAAKLKSGAERVWRRGKKKPSQQISES
ncbi:unnamed protein product [Cylindrotheca closterium]|uniref:Uncharacterized protein n=1 Tax=Cylindrotheca closterium TaxID=2856 RepID=A0AAD2FUU4_9STRA|nr:unnamed protein product [Cylindrotheca closterium]